MRIARLDLSNTPIGTDSYGLGNGYWPKANYLGKATDCLGAKGVLMMSFGDAAIIASGVVIGLLLGYALVTWLITKYL
jgi:hypothetical protein